MLSHQSHEVNFDGIIGNTHSHSGRSIGNIASFKHQALTSNTKEAALPGLQKVKALSGLGLSLIHI